MVSLRFNEAKATQVAALFLNMRGGEMSYLKLIKLLYFLDRESLLRWGRPVTTDKYVSMDKGPVVSRIFDLITDDHDPGEQSVWRTFISEPRNYCVSLLGEPGTEELSEAEEELARQVFEQYGHKNRWELVRLSHDLPEWTDPEGSAIPILYRDILKAGKKTPSEIETIERQLESLATAESIFGLH